MPSILAVPTKTWGGWLLLAAAKSMVGAGALVGVGAGVLVGAIVAVGASVLVGAMVAVGAVVGGVTTGTAVGATVGTGVGSDPQAAINKTANVKNIARPYCLFTINPPLLYFPLSQYLKLSIKS